jgi:hypothetical protein
MRYVTPQRARQRLLPDAEICGAAVSRSLVSHPHRKARKGAVELVDDNELGAASLEATPDAYGFAEARMESVGDACFSQLFVGGMSPFRAAAVPRAGFRSYDKLM